MYVHQSVDLATTRSSFYVTRSVGISKPRVVQRGEHCVCKRKAERKNKRKEKKILHVYCTLQKCVLFVRRTTKKVEI